MKTIRQIPHPDFVSARRLKPMEMNALRCQRQHTVLTPERLARIGIGGKTTRAQTALSDPDIAAGSATIH